MEVEGGVRGSWGVGSASSLLRDKDRPNRIRADLPRRTNESKRLDDAGIGRLIYAHSYQMIKTSFKYINLRPYC